MNQEIYSQLDAETRVALERKAAARAAVVAGLIEQAASIKTELDAINAMANYEANFHTKGNAVIGEWHNAFNGLQYESVKNIWIREFFGGEWLTIGEYLDLTKKISA